MKNRSIKRLFCLTIVLLFVAACGGGELRPVEFAREDMCAACKMAISEKRYAAEFLDDQKQPYMFDDVGCLRNYIKRKKPTVAACYFVDYESGAWLKAEESHFVRSSKFKTPMYSGIVAFGNAARAESAARENEGEHMDFKRLMEP